MIQKTLREMVHKAWDERRRLVAPLMGFPGLQLTGGTIKLAQQNYGEHFKVLKALADTFAPDLIFPLMDLAVEANALGRLTVFPTQDSATVVHENFDMEELSRLEQINIAFDTRLQGYVETVRLMSIGLPETILRGAYVTGPYSLAALIMGADQAATATVLNPDDLAMLCEFTTEKIEQYVRLLVGAGAQVICVLEPTAVMLGPEQFDRFSAQFVQHICNSCRYTNVAVVYHTCGNSMHLIKSMVASGVDALSLDSPESGVDLPEAARRAGDDIIIMGNICPTGTLLKGTPRAVEAEVNQLLRDMAFSKNLVLSTGCDLPQEVPLGNIAAFMNAGRRYRIPAKRGAPVSNSRQATDQC